MLLVLSFGVVGGFTAGGGGGPVATAAGFVMALGALVGMGFVTVLLVRLGAGGRARPSNDRRDDPAAFGPMPPPRAPAVGGREPRSLRPAIRLRRPASSPPVPADAPFPTALEWRFGEFLDLGFELEGALELAQEGVDVHLVRRLVGRGCPPALAARIGAPILSNPERRERTFREL